LVSPSKHSESRRKSMLSVTPSAKRKLKETLKNIEKEDELLIRIAKRSSNPAGIGFSLDKEKKGDRIIWDDDGEKLLLIADDIVPFLSDMVLDYEASAISTRFTITRSRTAI
jgi:Fe-S cluster assembly iron-binding protein IscA